MTSTAATALALEMTTIAIPVAQRMSGQATTLMTRVAQDTGVVADKLSGARICMMASIAEIWPVWLGRRNPCQGCACLEVYRRGELMGNRVAWHRPQDDMGVPAMTATAQIFASQWHDCQDALLAEGNCRVFADFGG